MFTSLVNVTKWLNRIRSFLSSASPDSLHNGVLCGLFAAICAYLIGLWLEVPSRQSNPFDSVFYIGTTTFFSILFVLLLTRRLSTLQTVLTIIGAVSAQFIGKLIYLLYFSPHPEKIPGEFTETFVWIPALFVLSAYATGLKRGRLLIALFLAVFSGISLVYVVSNWWAGTNFHVIYALLQMNLANLTLLALTHTFLGYKEDLTTTSARAERMEQLAYRDALTELPNRLALENTLAHLLAQRPETSRIAVAFVDIDGFKLINDSYGHAVGDMLLKEVAQRLRRAKREKDFAFRMSGDEFVLIFSDLPGGPNPLDVGERIRAHFAQPFTLGGLYQTISISVGVACSPDDGLDVPTLLKHADAAMYTVKHSGKDGVARYDARRDERAEERLELIRDLEQALHHETLALHYQPIIEVGSN